MKRVVADCSVIVKLFVPEVGSEASADLFEKWMVGGTEVWIPELAIIEFANVMWQKVRRKEIVKHLARGIIDDFLKLPFHVASHRQLAGPSLRLSMELDITAYDACYAALAHYLNAALFTADRKLAGSLKSGPIAVSVI